MTTEEPIHPVPVDPVDPFHPKDNFILDQSITRALVEGWDLQIEGKLGVVQSVIKQCRMLERTDEFCRFEARLRTAQPGQWVTVRFRVDSRSSLVNFWAWSGYSDTRLPQPLFSRGWLQMIDTKVGELFVMDYGNEDQALHGQAFELFHWSLDFDTMDYRKSHTTDGPTDYAPRNGNQTGGHWLYMGLTHPIYPIEQVRLRIYAQSMIPGVFVHRDGSWVTEEDYPDAMGAEHFIAHGGEHWINYTDPKNPWRDRAAAGWRCPDRQHLSVYCAMLQHAAHYSWDEGLRMLTEVCAHRYLRQVPGRDKGGTYHTMGADRQAGRELMVGADLILALKATDQIELSVKVLERVAERLTIQETEWDRRVKEYGHPWSFFTVNSSPPVTGYSPQEVGIHYWGLSKISSQAGETTVVLDRMAACSKYCFESFKYWDIPGDRRWGIPYYRSPTGEFPDTPCSGEHFAWLAASKYQPSSPAGEEKRREIMTLGVSLNPRWRE